MSIINQNPFRILGLSVIASERDIQRQITKTTRFAGCKPIITKGNSMENVEVGQFLVLGVVVIVGVI